MLRRIGSILRLGGERTTRQPERESRTQYRAKSSSTLDPAPKWSSPPAAIARPHDRAMAARSRSKLKVGRRVHDHAIIEFVVGPVNLIRARETYAKRFSYTRYVL
jgi:hypothetical protein